MTELTSDVNWLAVIVGAVVAYLLGWLWFSPKMFGKVWAAGVGLPPGPPEKFPATAMGFQALGTFLLAWVVGVTETSNALATIFLIVLMFIALQIAGGFFTQKSKAAIGVESGFVVAMFVIMIAAQAIL